MTISLPLVFCPIADLTPKTRRRHEINFVPVAVRTLATVVKGRYSYSSNFAGFVSISVHAHTYRWQHVSRLSAFVGGGKIFFRNIGNYHATLTAGVAQCCAQTIAGLLDSISNISRMKQAFSDFFPKL